MKPFQSVAFGSKIPKSDGRYIPIYSAPERGSYKLLVVNPGIESVMCHFWNDRNWPCQGSCEKCEPCSEGVGKRWRGYLGCFEPVHARLVLAEITVEAANNSNVDLEAEELNLRGLAVRMYRTAQHRRAPARVEFSAAEVQLPEDMQPFNVRAALLRIWNGRYKSEGTNRQ